MFDMRNQLVSVLENFLGGSLSLSGLQEWLLSRLQKILDSGDSTAIQAANAMDAAIVDLGECLISDKEFMDQAVASIRLMRTFEIATSKPELTESASTE